MYILKVLVYKEFFNLLDILNWNLEWYEECLLFLKYYKIIYYM